VLALLTALLTSLQTSTIASDDPIASRDPASDIKCSLNKVVIVRVGSEREETQNGTGRTHTIYCCSSSPLLLARTSEHPIGSSSSVATI